MQATINKSEKVSMVKIDPRIKAKMQELVASKDLEEQDSIDFLMEFIEECMTLEVAREKRDAAPKKPKAPKETIKFSKVSAYNMFKKAKAEGDWKTMSDEQKAEYEVMAAEENAIRREAAIKKAESGEEETSGDESKNRKTSGYHLFLKSKEEGKWSDMSDDDKAIWNAKATEANKDVVVEKKPKKEDIVYDSYQAALRYLRKKHADDKFSSWKALGLDAKESWNDFATTRLSLGMNKDLKRDLIVAAADAAYEQLKA
jgi:hypothetical protein